MGLEIDMTDVLITFDTTGSMYPCLAEVRQRVKLLVNELWQAVPTLRVGIIAHGDYCDVGISYVTRQLPFTTDKEKVIKFVGTVGRTHGGDSPECYELVLHQARNMAWMSDDRVVIMIGDDIPHGPTEAQNYLHLDWRDEADALHGKVGATIYAVQCLGRRGRG